MLRRYRFARYRQLRTRRVGLRAKRRRPLQSGLCVSLVLSVLAWTSGTAPLVADDISWGAGDGWFFEAHNWNPIGAPQNDDIIRIGNLPGTAGATVVMGGEWGIVHEGLHLSNGVTLDMNGSELLSFDMVAIHGNNTRLIARPAPYLNQDDFQGQLQLGAGAHFELRDNVSVVFFPISHSSGTVSGRGRMITSAFDNNGIIRPDANGGLILDAGQVEPNLTVDLDGSLGAGSLQLTTQFSELQVNAGSLTDSFSGAIALAPGALLDMNIADGWTADANSLIAVSGFNNVASSQIAGSHLTFAGTMNVSLAEGKLRVLAPMTIQPTASVHVGHTDRLEFDGNTTVQGGTFTMGQFAELQFDGPTTLTGGTFNTFGDNFTEGTVVFNGSTTWRGPVTINGSARQQGTATVSGPLGATIHAGLLDLDGLSGDTTWNINSALTINASQVGTTSSNRFAGTMNIAGGVLPRLTMNLADPDDSWIMAGDMTVAGQTHLYETRVAGAHMIVEGDLHVTGGRVRIEADTTFSDSGLAGPAQIHLGPEDAILRMHGQTVVESDVAFLGWGTLQNAPSGSLSLRDQVALNTAGLDNEGFLEIGVGAGTASVDRFETSGAWLAEIGGLLAGAEHDLLIVSGGEAVLGGVLEVELIDAGGGFFVPSIGDEFTILEALSGVSGAFLNDPVTSFDGQQFHWTVLYNPNDVTLQLTRISVPEPTGGLWIIVAGLCWLGYRRRALAPGLAPITDGAGGLQPGAPPSIAPRGTSAALPGLGWALRPAGLALATLALAAGNTISQAADKHWNTDSGSWGIANHWTPNGVPANGDHIWLGSLPGVQDSTVFLSQNATLSGLNIANGMALQNEGHGLVVNGDTTLSGEGSRLNITNAQFGADFTTNNLSIEKGSRVFLTDSVVVVQDQLSIASGGLLSRLFGDTGSMSFSAVNGATLRNNGRIQGGPGSMLFLQHQDGLFDLDGTTGAGEISVSGTSEASMTFVGQGLTDSFSGLITLGPHATLTMNMFGGWTADAASTLHVFDGGYDSEARLTGNPVELAGTIDVSGFADFRVQADATLTSTTNVTIGTQGRLEFVPFWSADVEGGTYSVGQQGELVLQGDTTISGGAFSTPSDQIADGAVHFNGDTAWSGDVVVQGVASQNGNATVTAPTVINAQRFDLDGSSNTHWNINSWLVINTSASGSSLGDTFGGVLDISGGFTAKLTLNFTGGDQQKLVLSDSGRLDLHGHDVLFVDRLAGSPVVQFGETNISDSKVQISADMDFMPNSIVNFDASSSELRLRGQTNIREAAIFNGDGSLINGIGGEMWLHDGANLSGVGLVNQGELGFRAFGFSEQAAIASVGGFSNEDDSTLYIRIGGYDLGDQHDHLLVTGGPTLLSGVLEVDLIDVGSGLFLPEVGDLFTILLSAQNISGSFDFNPVSEANGHAFHWLVHYEPHAVVLELDSITAIPEPSSAALLAAAGLVGCRLRYRRYC